MNKLMLLAAVAVGYVLGARAGRGRYEQIRQTAQRVRDDPRVQEKSQQAADLAKEKAQVATAAAVDKAQTVAAAAVDKVKGADDVETEATGWPPAAGGCCWWTATPRTRRFSFWGSSRGFPGNSRPG